jgi:tRNA threonylcarbamoyladenosine biosynthesis protein TsaB
MLESVKILHLETSSTVCSVSISVGEKIIDTIEVNEGYTHAENLHVFIDQTSKKSEIELREIQAIAISSGPGSYTGLRIGMSAAKGLCHVLQIPLIGVSSLLSICYSAEKKTKKSYYIPMIDARRMEVYFAVYDDEMNEVVSPSALVLNEDSVKIFKKYEDAIFLGSGVEKSKSILENTGSHEYLTQVYHSSRHLLKPALKSYYEKKFLDLAYSEPEYLKEFYDARKHQKE